MKVVLDTNVLLAAFAFGGVCNSILQECLANHRIILSEHILNEFSRHLSGKFGHSQADTKQRLDFLREVAQIVELDNITDGCRDKDDLPVLGTLTAGQADCLVTGDKDLLVLRQFKGLPILSPRQFKMAGNGRPYSWFLNPDS